MPGAAGPVLYVKYSQTIGAGTSSDNKQLHQLGARIAGNLCAAGGSLGRSRRIAGRGSRPADRMRWAVPGGSLGRCVAQLRALGGSRSYVWG